MDKHKDFIAFQIVGIKTEEFAIIEELFDKKNEQIQLGLDFSFAVDAEKRAVACSAEVKFLQDVKPFIKLKITNTYIVDENSWKRLEKDKKVILPKNFATHLLVLTIGTLRGVLHSKTEGTEFNRFVLPTLNVSDVINEDVKIEEK